MLATLVRERRFFTLTFVREPSQSQLISSLGFQLLVPAISLIAIQHERRCVLRMYGSN
jgi:hypothetical protein